MILFTRQPLKRAYFANFQFYLFFYKQLGQVGGGSVLTSVCAR